MKKANLLLVCLFFFQGAWAQDAAFMNTHHSLVQFNPSFAGSSGFLRNQTIYRNQWPNLSGTTVTYGTFFDGYIKAVRGGLAISATSDDQARGTLRLTQFSTSYAQYISVGEYWKIIPSIRATYAQYTLDKGRLNFHDRINNRFDQVWTGSVVPSSMRKYTDVSVGLLFEHNQLYFGASCAHINEPNISLFSDQEYKIPISTIIHASSNVAINPRTSGNMLLMFTTQGPYQSAGGRILSCFNQRIIFGLGYFNFWTRGFHQAAVYAGITKKALTLSYCYDRGFSKLSSSSAGSHEISISLALKRKSEQWKAGPLEVK